MSCRICLDDDNQHNLISPCLCKGTSKWIHHTCLMKWINTTTNSEAKTKCTICKYQYKKKHANRYMYLLTIPPIFVVLLVY